MGRVFLFSGHMVDRHDRRTPRFPPTAVDTVREAVAEAMDVQDAGSSDVAICSAACGGDLLFAHQCLERGMRLEIYLPEPEHDFVQNSVAFAGEEWVRLYDELKRSELSTLREMTASLGPSPEDIDIYSRTNMWMLYRALGIGNEKIHLVTVWDQQGGDGPGGTKHMYELVTQRGGQVTNIDLVRLLRGGS